VKWIGSGYFRSANNTVLYSGHNTHKKNGVGVIITNQMSESLIGYKAVNDRIIYIRMNAHPINITCVQIYAPTTSTETADIEEFYRNLHSTLNEILRKDVLIIMGDWNKGEELRTEGKYGLGNRNAESDSLSSAKKMTSS
jgi:aromatic ring-opening dioxygenase LigB subunit